MSMFSNYDSEGLKYNLTEDYTEKEHVLDYTTPFELYDDLGNIKAFSWHYGDKFILTEHDYYNIKVPIDSRVYECAELYPTEETFGECCQMAYNTITWKCWRCAGQEDDKYIWNEVPLEVYCEDGMIISLQIPANRITLNILNFRHEKIYSYEMQDAIQVQITTEDQPALVQGQFFLEEIMSTHNGTQVLKLIPLTIK